MTISRLRRPPVPARHEAVGHASASKNVIWGGGGSGMGAARPSLWRRRSCAATRGPFFHVPLSSVPSCARDALSACSWSRQQTANGGGGGALHASSMPRRRRGRCHMGESAGTTGVGCALGRPCDSTDIEGGRVCAGGGLLGAAVEVEAAETACWVVCRWRRRLKRW